MSSTYADYSTGTAIRAARKGARPFFLELGGPCPKGGGPPKGGGAPFFESARQAKGAELTTVDGRAPFFENVCKECCGTRTEMWLPVRMSVHGKIVVTMTMIANSR